MKRVFSLSALAALLAVASFAASTQAVIPFDFKAGSVNLPAGIYRIEQPQLPGIVTVIARDGRRVYVLSRPGQATPQLNSSKLIFVRQAHGYSLSEIQFASTTSTSRLPVTGPSAYQVALVTQ